MTKNKIPQKSSDATGQLRSVAQHLVELILFFPFLIGIIGILTEIAYGLNTSIEFNSALNLAVSQTSSIQRTYENSNIQTLNSQVQDKTRTLLEARSVPYSNTVEVQTLEAGDFMVFIATYKYACAFKLVNMFFPAIPENFYFKSSVITNKSLFKPNNYNILDDELTRIFNIYAAKEHAGADEN